MLGKRAICKKSIIFYTLANNSLKIRLKIISFTRAFTKRKYLGINLIKEIQDLYSENYNTLLKESKGVLNQWKNIPCLWIGRLNIPKMAILPKLIYRLNAILIKIAAGFVLEIEKLILKFLWKCKDWLGIVKHSWQRRKLENSHIDRRNRVENPVCWQIDFQQYCQGNSMRERIVFSSNCAKESSCTP